MASTVEANHPELAGRFLTSRPYVGSGYLDLRASPAEELNPILDAAVLELERIAKAGPESFHDPIFYPTYVEACEELCDMLRVGLDERSAKSDP